jgi:UDP-N-acetyl-D-mannosaminuronate dehydrogenase
VAFLEDSDDPRNTPTRDLLNFLKEKGYEYSVHDPHVRQNMVEFSFSTNLDEVINDSDAIIVVTARQEYRSLDLVHAKSIMKKKPILIDGRKTFDPSEVKRLGFTYQRIGLGQH